jgi:hypothetical protein
MNDYFDELEAGLRDAARRRAHLPWYTRLGRLSVRHRGLAALVAVLVVATPTVAAVGAVAGWFAKGKPDIYYPASATSGLGKVLPKGDRLLPIRVSDPDGGPTWGMRLVRTTRGDTCIQVGRVEYGQIGALGIDGAWDDDHEFHEIKPNDGLADICGATDAAGNGFADQASYGAPASVDVPLYNSGGGSPDRCRNPFESVRPLALSRGGKLPARLKQTLEQVAKRRLASPKCPAHAMRMIFAGLLGPDAKRITYMTPSGQIESQQTSGGVGAYLIVLRETAANCDDFTQTAFTAGGNGCQSDGTGGDGADLQAPTPIVSVTYANGKTCRAQPSMKLESAYVAFNKRMRARFAKESGAEVRAQVSRFFASYHLTTTAGLRALMPRCGPVGWVAPSGPKLGAVDVRTPLKVSVTEGRRFCSKGPWRANSVQDSTIVCNGDVPAGYTAYWESGLGRRGPLFALIRVSFIAREPVTTTNSFYSWNLQAPGNHGGASNRTQANVRRGERVTFTLSQAIPGTGPGGGDDPRGVYRGTITFTENVGQAGPQNGGTDPGHDGSLIVGRFSVRLPRHR